ncbi:MULTISPECIES: hydantoinase B/oxoprolinase family protein [Brucella/Ochrobactrum group]|jgi:N-methylhydantoinase B|uniref:Hydantoinase B/oxoprolinase family protein n=1 Tax=Brucella pseudintermedia TaxID=370111 RepID=A0ABY5UK17_9HYPH|nr:MULTISPECIES: hydantoinase B/oxoprolinase family protein [Brucella/Ochrobactrum group]KAB2682857.1 hydantoinase B/oxoprolinase family protein [Brucella pseudintermedia]MCO7728185.1 hydantoinase B/oxoprolinase family protein [Brucella intermedia]TWH03467.1 N-methylhydantoinase B [Ochrobactrum sp. J50]UWL63007.1 hydantoinase B/oxoprolinase family protein [Brucella pseudintermedia]WPM82168.1 hydantoinase B/oxoprolinase family protein [Brucella pseudintermedia]
MTKKPISDVHMQITWNRLISVVEEQAVTLIRTAFSTSVRESGDLSAGVFNRAGLMIAQAVTGTPGHVNAMAEAVGHFINDIGRENIYEGDVYITNDPWKGTGHLHDFTVVSPSFRKGKLTGFFACTAHVVDVGGRGFGPDANEVYEEGIFVPIMKFAERGVVNKDLVNILRNNVRESHQVVGDVYSLAACNEIGHRRLMDMMDEFQLDDLEGLADFIFKRSYDATLERLASLPHGTYSNVMRVDGYGDPIDIAVRIDVHADHILADFAGTSAPSPKGINCPLIYSAAYACYGLKCSLAPEIPNNHASLLPFKVTAPKDCILNAQRPAPVSVRHVLGHLVPDAVLGAVHKMLPGKVPAEGSGALWNLHVSARPLTGKDAPRDGGQRAEVLLFNSGGTGARSHLDGLSATAFPSGVHSMSIEATEHVGPVIFWRKELRDGSGGAGQFRGGLGQVVEIAPTEGHEIYFNAMFDRIKHPPRGREGGENGAAGAVLLDDGTVLNAKGRQHVPAGRRLILQLPGGGGYGPLDKRDAEAVKRDRDFDYVVNG